MVKCINYIPRYVQSSVFPKKSGIYYIIGESAVIFCENGALSLLPFKNRQHRLNENSSNEKRLAALGSRGRGPPRSGGRAWSFRLLDFHKNTTRGKVSFPQRLA